nr:MAG TPA: hypothetical protein [Caudoviricetes sp.]
MAGRDWYLSIIASYGVQRDSQFHIGRWPAGLAGRHCHFASYRA